MHQIQVSRLLPVALSPAATRVYLGQAMIITSKELAVSSK